MILDKLTQLGTAQAFTESDEKTTFSYDCGNPVVKNRVGTGERLSVVFVITTAAAGDSASITDTCDFCAVEDTVAALSGSTVIIQRRVPASELVPGKIIEVPLPSGKPTKRYLGGQVVLGASDTLSASSYIIPSDHVQEFTAYAKSYVV